MKYIISLCLVALMSVLFTGCRTATIPTMDTPVYDTSKSTVEQAIMNGCRARGWVPRKVSDSEIEATLNVRSHTAVVSIPYSAKGYKITYKNSNNLKYDATSNSIHSNYVNWVRNLDRSISSYLIQDSGAPLGK